MVGRRGDHVQRDSMIRVVYSRYHDALVLEVENVLHNPEEED